MIESIRHKVSTVLNGQGAKNERSERMRKNAIGSVAIKFIAMLITFINVPVVLSFLSNELYGIWLTISSILLWTRHFDFGLSAGLRFRLTEALANKDYDGGKRLVSTAYISMSFLMLMVFVCSIPVVYSIDWNQLLNTYAVSNDELKITMLLGLLIFTSEFVLRLISTILKADQKTALSDIFAPLSSLVSLLLILIMGLFTNNSLLYACLAISVPNVIILLIFSIYYFRKEYKEIAPSISFFDKSKIRVIYSMGLKFFVGSLSSLVVFSTSSFIISHYVGPEDVAIYNTAKTYFGLIVVLSVTLREPLKPAITDAFVKGEMTWIRNTMNMMFKTSVLLSILSLFFFFFGDIAISIWTHNRISVPFILAISFTFYAILNVFAAPFNNFLAGIGKLDVNMIINVVKIIIFIPIAISLVKWKGSVGMVYAIILVNLLPMIVFGWIQYNAIINNRARGIWNK